LPEKKKEEKRIDADPSPRIPIGSFDVSTFFSRQPASSRIGRESTIQSMRYAFWELPVGCRQARVAEIETE
jgi:hypothetical protein